MVLTAFGRISVVPVDTVARTVPPHSWLTVLAFASATSQEGDGGVPSHGTQDGSVGGVVTGGGDTQEEGVPTMVPVSVGVAIDARHPDETYAFGQIGSCQAPANAPASAAV